MRSKLFVPASRPELFDKALASQADGISIDLEDAVVPERKDEARATLGRWLQEGRKTRPGQWTLVRVNAMDTPHFARDIDAVVQPGLDIVNLPKPASADAVREAVQAIARAERRNGVQRPVQLLLNIETPESLRQAHLLARADDRVMGLQVGLGDLFEPLGIDRRETVAIQQVLFRVRMAAGEAGIAALDGAFADVRDAEGFLAEARMAKRMGFTGKSCIHPSQVALANQAFRPDDAEIAHALEVVGALEAARACGLGAFMVDGRMVDPPFIRRAEAIVAMARRFDLIPQA